MQVRAQGTYINDKIDLLIEYLLVDPFQRLFKRIFKHDVRSIRPPLTCCSIFKQKHDPRHRASTSSASECRLYHYVQWMGSFVGVCSRAQTLWPGIVPNLFWFTCHHESAPHGCTLSFQAKLHIALDLGDASGDGGYTFGEGPAAAAGVRKSNSSNSASGPTKEVEMQGLDSAGEAEEDEALLHSASQVGHCLAFSAASCELLAHGLQQWWAFIDTWEHVGVADAEICSHTHAQAAQRVDETLVGDLDLGAACDLAMGASHHRSSSSSSAQLVY